MGELNNLEELYLEYSSIDKSFLHKIGLMTSLNILAMNGCGLMGTLPPQGRFYFSTTILFRIIRIATLRKRVITIVEPNN